MKQLLWITGLTATATVTLVAALLLLASCSQEDDGGTPGGEDRVALTVTDVFVAAEGINTDTRAVPVPVTKGKLGVGVRAGNGYAAQTGVEFTCAGGKWSSPAPVLLSKDPVSLYAYYPQEGYGMDGSGNIEIYPQPYSSAKDLGYARSGGENVCSAHPYAGFVLRHAYARVKVSIAFSRFFGNASTLEAVSVSAGGIYSKGTQNAESGRLTAGPGTLPKWDLPAGQTMADMNRIYNGDMLVVPSASLTDAKLTVIVNGKKWEADLSSAFTSVEAGKSYRIKAQIDLDGVDLEISKVELETWTSGTSQSGDTQFE